MLNGLARGLELALRAGAAPLLIGARLTRRFREIRPPDLPAPRRGLGTFSKIALDELFFATELASASVISFRDRGRIVAEMEDAVELFDERGWLTDPSSYHRDPPPLARVLLERGSTPGLSYEHMRFESGYAPHPGEPGRERWLGYQANHTAHAWVLRHPGPPRAWVVCIPGYRMGHPWVDFAGFRARWMHQKLGLNVAIPVLPLHGPRRIGRRGGDGFFTGDFVDTLHAQAQAIWDVRRLITWLLDQGAPAVGIHGVSLGGYTTALVASLQDGLDCVIAGIPATDFVRLVRSHVPAVLLRAADRLGFDFDRIERLLHVVSPLAFEPKVPRERRYLYAGVFDRLASPEHARDLWHHWDRPRVAWYSGSHVSFLWEPEVKRLLHEAFNDSGLLERRVG